MPIIELIVLIAVWDVITVVTEKGRNEQKCFSCWQGIAEPFVMWLKKR